MLGIASDGGYLEGKELAIRIALKPDEIDMSIVQHRIRVLHAYHALLSEGLDIAPARAGARRPALDESISMARCTVVKYCMRYVDLLEAIGPPVLYHGTSFVGLLAGFTDNVLRGYPTDVRRDGKIAHNGSPRVSFTRDLRAARSHAGKDVRKVEGGRAILVLDRDRLARRFGRKLQPSWSSA